jgi:sugar phosphate isomerase/epimerase
MKTLFFCPRWGSEAIPFDDFFARVKSAGYDGVEMALPLDTRERDTILTQLRAHQLQLIGQHWECTLSPSDTYEADFERYLYNLAEARPLFINSQTGKDFFTFERNVSLIQRADEISRETGVKIVHETHRGKFSFSINVLAPYLDNLPDLRLCADFSHWCAVAESLLQDPEQQAILQTVFPRVDHIHTRVGFPQGPQVSDPRAPEFAEALECHLHWWDAIIARQRAAGAQTFTLTTEFGPAPYMPLLPYTRQPITSQWEINVHMMQLLRERYSR